MRIIGTDICLDVCKEEGYMMVQYDARKKFDPDAQYRVFCHYPGWQMPDDWEEELRTDETHSFNELKEIYLRNKKSLDKTFETDTNVNFDDPGYYDFLNLASDVVGGEYE